MKKIASILCDGGGSKKGYRRNIYLHCGRLICDGEDITPHADSYSYPRGEKGYKMAEEDIAAMYALACWELEWAYWWF